MAVKIWALSKAGSAVKIYQKIAASRRPTAFTNSVSFGVKCLTISVLVTAYKFGNFWKISFCVKNGFSRNFLFRKDRWQMENSFLVGKIW